MAISVNWSTKVIFIPRADLTLIQSSPTEIRQLDMDIFRLELKDLEDGEEGMVFLDTHDHVPPKAIGGITLARVIEIINGYTVTFEDGQYAVNLVGANTNLADVANVNQVSIRSSNSAGLVNIQEIKMQSFQNARVWINTNFGSSGIEFPTGTPSKPTDNPTDAINIALLYKLERFHLSGDITLPNGENFISTDWEGHSILSSSINLNNVEVDNSYFKNIDLYGSCNGYIDVEECKITDVQNFKGIVQNSSIEQITLDDTNTDLIHISNCVSHSTSTVLDLNSANCNVLVRDFFGEIDLRNLDQGNVVNLGLSGGKIHIKNSCTSGTVIINGICELIDESGSGCNVITNGKITLKPLTKGTFIALK